MDTIIRDSLELIPVSTPNGFFAHGGISFLPYEGNFLLLQGVGFSCVLVGFRGVLLCPRTFLSCFMTSKSLPVEFELRVAVLKVL